MAEMMRPGHGVALLTIALLVIGVIMVNSTGVRVGASVPRISIEGVFFGVPAAHAALAVMALVVGAWIPLRKVEALRGFAAPAPWALAAAVLLLLLVWLPDTGRAINSSRRWIELGGVRFHASEAVKWTLPFFLAWACTRPGFRVDRFFRGLVPLLMVVGVVVLLIAIEDLGTAVLVGGVAVLVLFAAGARLLHLGALAPIGMVGLYLGIVTQPYRMQRLVTFVDPFADPEGGGWHIIQSLQAISGGGLVGRGLGAGEQKFDLASDTTDFIFSIICEELGLIGAGLVLAAFVALLLCGLSIIRDSRSEASDGGEQPGSLEPFMRLLGLGVLLTVGLQATINIFVTTAMLPTKGIALPLISRGGTGWILTAFCLGMLLAIERARRVACPEQLEATVVENRETVVS